MLVRLKQAEKLVLNGPQTKRHRPSRWGCTAHRENKDCNDANQQSISNRLIRLGMEELLSTSAGTTEYNHSGAEKQPHQYDGAQLSSHSDGATTETYGRRPFDEFLALQTPGRCVSVTGPGKFKRPSGVPHKGTVQLLCRGLLNCKTVYWCEEKSPGSKLPPAAAMELG